MGIKTESIKINGKGWRRVLEDFEDEYGTLPAGLVFDGASAPAFLYPWVPPFQNLEVSCRHDWDCKQAREEMAESISWRAKGMGDTANDWEKVALKSRSDADTRYRKGMIKAKRASYKWKWRGNVVGWAAWVGVRVGSFCGVGW